MSLLTDIIKFILQNNVINVYYIVFLQRIHYQLQKIHQQNIQLANQTKHDKSNVIFSPYGAYVFKRKIHSSCNKTLVIWMLLYRCFFTCSNTKNLKSSESWPCSWKWATKGASAMLFFIRDLCSHMQVHTAHLEELTYNNIGITKVLLQLEARLIFHFKTYAPCGLNISFDLSPFI